MFIIDVFAKSRTSWVHGSFYSWIKRLGPEGDYSLLSSARRRVRGTIPTPTVLLHGVARNLSV